MLRLQFNKQNGLKVLQKRTFVDTKHTNVHILLVMELDIVAGWLCCCSVCARMVCPRCSRTYQAVQCPYGCYVGSGQIEMRCTISCWNSFIMLLWFALK